MKKFILFFCLTVFFFSCEEETVREKTEKYCWEEMVFTCTEPLGESYFKGEINGDYFCVSDGVDGYWMGNSIGTVTSTPTSNPTLVPGYTPQYSFFGFSFGPPIINNYNGIAEDFSPYITIWTPLVADSTILPANEYFDRFIKEGDLPMRSKNVSDEEGFYFMISWSCVFLPGYFHYNSQGPDMIIPVEGVSLTPTTGKQKNAIFRISEYQKIVTPDHYIYDLTFEITCDLYSTSTRDPKRFGRLEEGKFKTRVVLDKDE